MPEDINSSFWSNEAFNGEIIRKYSTKEGVNPKDFEIQIWAYDTLNILKEHSDLDLFFKGGTSVQTLLPRDFQRFSIDLDFNIETENRTKEFILTKFRELNEKLEREDLLVPVSETKYKTKSSENLIYGKFYPLYFDIFSGTITFVRVVMTKVMSRKTKIYYYDELIKKELLEGFFNFIKVQINIKHRTPALMSEDRDIDLKIRKYPEYKKELKFKCLSPGDLFADKLMAFQDRAAFKDLYDLGMMRKIMTDHDINICKQKIKLIRGDKKIIQDVVEKIELALKDQVYLDHIYSLPRGVRSLIRDRMFYTELIDVLEGF